jgi:hypothetical protein
MKLTDLNPSWFGAGGAGISRRQPDGSLMPAPERRGVGLAFDCPCGCDEKVYVALSNPLDGGAPYTDPGEPTWQRTGDTFEALTLSPSLQRIGGCGWHGWVRGGEVIAC